MDDVTSTTPIPHCLFCLQNHGAHVAAEFIAAQSTDAGETVEWVLVCRTHASGWNEGGDWQAPLYPINPAGVLAAPLSASAARALDDNV